MTGLVILFGILFVIPITLGIFTIGRNQGQAGSKESAERSQTVLYLYAALSIIAAFGLGILASYIGYDYLKLHYALPFWVNCGLTFLIVVGVLSVCGLAIAFVMPATNKNLAWAIVLTSFMCLGISGVVTHYRGDYFDYENGKTKVWVTPSTGKIWWNKPKNVEYDPTTGEKLEKATPDIIKKILQKKAAQAQAAAARRRSVRTWKTVFSKEYVGVGFTGGDDPDNDGTLYTAKFGKDILIGDKIIVETYRNKNIEVWCGGWKKYHSPIINQAGTKGYFCVRAPKGIKFKVIIKRFE